MQTLPLRHLNGQDRDPGIFLIPIGKSMGSIRTKNSRGIKKKSAIVVLEQ